MLTWMAFEDMLLAVFADTSAAEFYRNHPRKPGFRLNAHHSRSCIFNVARAQKEIIFPQPGTAFNILPRAADLLTAWAPSPQRLQDLLTAPCNVCVVVMTSAGVPGFERFLQAASERFHQNGWT